MNSNKWNILEEKIDKLSEGLRIVRKENSRLKRTNDELSQKAAALEEENKVAKKFLKDKETVKNKVMSILDEMEKAGV